MKKRNTTTPSRIGKIMSEVGKWVRPVIVYAVGVLIYNFIIIGNLDGIPGEFSSVKIDSKYKIACNFEIKNKGFLPIDSKKIQLIIPKDTTILNIDIPRQYNHLYKITGGGENYNFVIFSIEGLKGRQSIKGSISFSQYSKWEKDYVNPITFSK